MKKAVLSVLILMFIFSFAACGMSDDAPQKENFALNETAVFSKLKITATEIVRSEGVEYFAPGEGKVFIGVKFTLENISDETLTVSSILLFDAYADDVKCDYSISAVMAFSAGTLDGELTAGKKMEGYYALEVPDDTQVIEIEFSSDWLNDSKAVFTLDVPQG